MKMHILIIINKKKPDCFFFIEKLLGFLSLFPQNFHNDYEIKIIFHMAYMCPRS